MSMNNKVINVTIAAMISAVLGFSATHAMAAVKMEKCAGIVKAGKNDCAAAKHACAGQAKMSSDATEWVYVPKGTCDKIVGGHVIAGKTSALAKNSKLAAAHNNHKNANKTAANQNSTQLAEAHKSHKNPKTAANNNAQQLAEAHTSHKNAHKTAANQNNTQLAEAHKTHKNPKTAAKNNTPQLADAHKSHKNANKTREELKEALTHPDNYKDTNELDKETAHQPEQPFIPDAVPPTNVQLSDK